MINRLYSLPIYLLFYIAALYLFRQDEIRCQRKISMWGYGAILVLALMAALRADTVGTDAYAYGVRALNQALSAENFLAFFKLNTGGETEVLFRGLTYINAHLTGSVPFFFAAVALMTILPIYIGVKKVQTQFSSTFCMMVFLLLYFPMSFNIMQQSAAAAFLFLAYICWTVENKKKLAVLLACVSCTIHTSAFLGIAFFVLIPFISTKKSVIVRWTLLLLSTIVVFFVFQNLDTFVKSMLGEDGLFSGYLSYYEVFTGGKTNSYFFTIDAYSIYEMIFRVCFVVFIYLFHSDSDDTISKRTIMYFSVANLICYTLFRFMFGTSYGYRLLLYVDYINMIALATRTRRRSFSLRRVPLPSLLVFVLMASYFICIYFVAGAHDAVPYLFR